MAGRILTERFGSRSQRLVLYVGVFLAILAAALVFYIVNNAESGGGGGKLPVVVAAQDIPANSRLTTAMLEVKYLTTDEANAEAFSARSQVTDRIVTQEVKAGQQIVPSVVSDKAGDSLAFKVAPGQRAVSINVREVVTAGGNVRAGDHVDIVGIFEFEVSGLSGLDALYRAVALFAPEGTPGALYYGVDVDVPSGGTYILTVTVLQNVKVLGLAQSLAPESAAGETAADVNNEAEAEPSADSATLELTPEQAQLITLADEYGILRMSARAVGDEGFTPVEPTIIQVEKTN